jgi:2'-5' RNA ligase
MRTFIAIDLDDQLKKNLEALIDGLRPNGKNVRWVRSEAMHLTLKFLGEIPEENVAKIESALVGVAKKHRPFTLKLRGTGVFPPGRRDPRVVWVGVEGDSSLKELQEAIESAMEKLGFAREKRDFRPHLTLGRVKFPSRLESLLADLEKHKETTFGEMQVRRVTFFRSTLRPSGAEYSVLSELPLG